MGCKIIIEIKIMTSTMWKLSKMAVVMTITIYAISTLDTLIPPFSTQMHDQVNGGDELYHADDYGIWNPSPGNWRRGRGAPIPHQQEKLNHHQ